VVRPGTLIVFSFGVYLAYLARTHYDVRNFDAAGHLRYVQILAHEHRLPQARDCSVCHHPPAYHLLAAATLRALEKLGVSDVTRGLQFLSLGIWSLFVLFVVLAVRELIPQSRARLLATALVLLWPYSIIQSARVNNDTLVDALAAAVFYFLIRWRKEGRARWLASAVGGAALGLATKSSALVLVALVLGVVLLRALEDRRVLEQRALLRRIIPSLVALVLMMLVWGATRARHGVYEGVMGRAGTDQPAWRGARFYVAFDPRRMLDDPYARVFLDHSREPSFWNHELKSSLYGTRTFGKLPPDTLQPPIELVRWENRIVLALATLLLIAVWVGPPHPGRGLCLLTAALFIAGGLVFHLLAPRDHHADFRFIFPVLLPLSVLYAISLEGLRRLRVVGELIAIVFLWVSVVSLVHMKLSYGSDGGSFADGTIYRISRP
jgi:4-amino-4-deoxy-L-arabinose transferase-like glycosyltransferase